MSDKRELFAQEMFGKIGQSHPFDLLMEAQNRANEAGHNFAGDHGYTAIDDLADEVVELKDSIVSEEQGEKHIRNEIGDVFFCLLNVCREQGINPHEALEKSVERWLKRKSLHEQKVVQEGYTWRTLPSDKSYQFWQEVKQELKQEEYK